MHGSLRLPQYRGRCPVNWAILNGETITGITLHRIVQKIDAGDIIYQKEVTITDQDTAGDVQDRLDQATYDLLMEHGCDIVMGTIPSCPQSLSHGSYYGGRTPEDGRIDITKNHRTIFNLVRAVLPYPRFPGAFLDEHHIVDVSLTPVHTGEKWITVHGCDGVPIFLKPSTLSEK